jgi:DNA-binding response OmpR family regulator
MNNSNALILLVEDNKQILFGNERMLKRRGYDVMTALTLNEAKERISEVMPDAIILDIMLPDGSGLDFMRELRVTSNVPVLLLTGLTTPEDIVRGLSDGGDDYLTKPYDFGVFMARIEALLRRAKLLTEVIQKGSVKLNVLLGQAFVGNEDLLLTQKEFALLLLFVQNEEKVITAEVLSERVWKLPFTGNTQAIKSAISRLRKKLENSDYTVSSLRNEGYIFEKQ